MLSKQQTAIKKLQEERKCPKKTLEEMPLDFSLQNILYLQNEPQKKQNTFSIYTTIMLHALPINYCLFVLLTALYDSLT